MKKVMYDSDEAAQMVTVTGWRSRHGHFYGENEHLARWSGCTHSVCECGAEMERGYTICRDCSDAKRKASYEAMPIVKWDGLTPLVLHDDDRYFFDEDSVHDYCEDEGLSVAELLLVVCEPNYAPEIDVDYCADILPEDQTLEDVYPDLAEAIEKVNALIREQAKPISWGAGKYRTSIARAEAKPTEAA